MRRTESGLCASALVFAAVSTLSTAAFAQDPHPAQDPPPPAVARAEAQGTVSTNTGATGGGAMTLPEREDRRARAYAGDTDHDAVVGNLAIGYLGRRSILVGTGAAGGLDAPAAVLNAPVIGVRYWFNPMIGLDAGLGMLIQSDGSEAGGVDGPGNSRSAFILHGGVPIALATSQHFVFEIIPEANLGFSSYSQDAAGPGLPEGSGSGFHFDIGARAGAEIHFGFIGLPKLALQATVGLAFASDSVKYEEGGPEVKAHRTSLATSVQDNPWNIFTSNVGALYYF